MMRCRNCGAVIPEDSRFCPSCGLLNNIHIDFTEGHHPTRVVHYSMPERLRERIAARRAAEAASALSKENGETGDAIVSSLNTSSAGNGEREAAAKAEILNEEASEKAAYVVKTELPESEKSDIKAAEAEEIEASSDGTSGLELEATDSAESLDSESKTSEGAEVMEAQAGESVEAEEIAEAIEETADEATVEEAADAVKTEPAESGDSDTEKAEAENEKELSCVEADNTSDVTKAQELEPYSAVEKETESHAEPVIKVDASALSEANRGTGDAIVSSLTSPAGNGERAAAKAEVLNEEASEKAAYVVKTELPESEKSDIKAAEAEEIAEAIEETADEATVEEAADAVKTEPAESGDSDTEKAEAENEKELSCVEADDTSDVTKVQKLEPYSAVEKETESHAEPALEAASALSKENGETGDAIVSSLNTSSAGNDEREAAAKAEVLNEEAREEAADAVKTEPAEFEGADIRAAEAEEIAASSDGTSGLKLEATDSAESLDLESETSDGAESSDVMTQLAAEIERRQREQEEEEIRILSGQILVRIRELSGINAPVDEDNKNSVSENTELYSDMGSAADIQSEGSSEMDETEQEADIEVQDIEAEEDLNKDIQEGSVQIHNISEYRSEDINTEEGQAPELFEFDEAVEEEDGYMGEDPGFEAMASLPPDPSKWGSAIRSRRKLLLPMGIAIAAALSTLYYVNTPAVVLERGIKQSRRLIEKQSYEAALPVLSGLLEKNPDNRELYLLIINAYINSGKHEEALSAVETAVEKLPEDTELSGLYRQLKPEVEFIPSLLEAKGGYTDPVEISLYNVDNYKIHYSLEGGGKNLSDAVYEEAIALSTNGDYVITAYADAVDGAPGPSYTASYRVRLDPEKYHLDDWEQSDRGVSYITETGERVKGWFIKDDRSYYFDNDGYMLTGLAEIEQNSYFFSEDGVMQTGWVDYNGERRFFDADGKMLHSLWVDETYYLGDDGVMLRDTTVDGIYVDAEGMRSFSAAEEYSRHPDTIVVAKSGSRIDRGEYFELSAELYHSKANGRPAGEKDREIRLKLRKDAWMKYLDGGLISIQARDAVRFLPELYMQEISQNEAGEITGYSILLGEKR